jgi:hypothetical protein
MVTAIIKEYFGMDTPCNFIVAKSNDGLEGILDLLP